jgi:hypothetical protein
VYLWSNPLNASAKPAFAAAICVEEGTQLRHDRPPDP